MTDQELTGVGGIGAERYRHITEEGYTPEGDIGRSGELMMAAGIYINHAYALEQMGVDLTVDEAGGGNWPWAPEFFKPGPTSERTLEKAGALVAAAIDAMKQERKING